MATPAPPPIQLPLDIFGIPLVLFPFIVIIPIALVVVMGFLLILWFKLIPPDAKDLFWAARGRRTGDILNFVCGEEGRARFMLGKPLPKGLQNLGTEDKPKYIFLPRAIDGTEFQLPVPEIPFVDQITGRPYSPEERTNLKTTMYADYVEKQKELNAQRDMALNSQQMVLKRTFLEGLNRPTYMVYSGKAVSVTPTALAALNLSEMNPTNNPNRSVWGDIPQKLRLHGVKLPSTDAEILFGIPLDVRALKAVIPNNYTDSQLDSVAIDAYMKGLSRGRQQGNAIIKYLIIGLIAIVIIAIALKVLGIL